MAIALAEPTLLRKLIAIVRGAGSLSVTSVLNGDTPRDLPRAKRANVTLLCAAGRRAEAAAWLCRATQDTPPQRVVVIVDAGETSSHHAALAAGALGVVAAPLQPIEVVAALHAAAGGGVYLCQRVAASFLAAVKRGLPAYSAPATQLTGRELEVLSLRAQGFPYKFIAARLHLSEHTVTNHLFNVHQKLGVHSTIEALNIVFTAGSTPP